MEIQIEALPTVHMINLEISPWIYPVVIFSEKIGSHRFCMDNQVLNIKLQADKFPLPKTEYVINYMGDAKPFSKLNIVDSYWQIKWAEYVLEKSAFKFKVGFF